MTTALITHTACLDHDTGSSHPESPARLQAILSALASDDFTALYRCQARLASADDLQRVHGSDYLQKFHSFCQQISQNFIKNKNTKPNNWDPDTLVSVGTQQAALYAAGAGLTALDLLAQKKCDNAFCAIRPPGHHAEKDNAMGFCFYNNVAIAAAYARQKYGWNRIAIIDFDVHHGNGTQDIFHNDPDIFYYSTHQSPLYPGTGNRHETGIAQNILNMPLPLHTDSTAFRQVITDTLLPALRHFSPELILISAGFDAHAEDHISHLNLQDEDYIWITQQITKIARHSCENRIVSLLEGGYDLASLARASAAHVKILMDI